MATSRTLQIGACGGPNLFDTALAFDEQFLVPLLTCDSPALRCVCRGFQQCVDSHDLQIQKDVVQRQLREVCSFSGAVYAVFWAIRKGSGVLQAVCHYNPAERIEHVKGTLGADTLYSTESYAFSFLPGHGLIGKAFLNRNEHFFFQDVETLPEEIFIRKHVALKFGIKSVAVLWYKGGVLEFGTTDKWASLNWACTDC